MKCAATFWKVHPPLFVGLFLLVGVGIAFGAIWPACIFAVALLIPLKSISSVERIVLFLGALAIATSAYLYSRYLYQLPTLSSPVKGEYYFKIDAARKNRSPFTWGTVYEGKILIAKVENATYYNLPCRVYFPKNKKRPRAHCDYWVSGSLKQINSFSYCLKPTSGWTPVEGTHSFAEKRFEIKQNVKKYIQPYFPDQRSFLFFSGLMTGELEDSLLSFEFGRLGLSHLLAISGFHFALVVFFFSIILRRFFSWRITSALLIGFISLYFAYIGNAPSVTRAWSALLLILFGSVLGLKTKPLNALGIALITAILYDPILCTRLGFCLSYVATFALLGFTPIVEKGLEFFFPRRPKYEVLKMRVFDKHIAILSQILRKALSINIAISLFTAPILLATFHKYPLLSLFYNLLIPLCVSFVLFFCLCGLTLSLIHPLVAKPFFFLCSSVSSFLLDQIEFYPRFFDISLYSHSFSITLALFFLIPLILVTFLDKITSPSNTFEHSGGRSSAG